MLQVGESDREEILRYLLYRKATNFQHEGVAVLHPLRHWAEMNRSTMKKCNTKSYYDYESRSEMTQSRTNLVMSVVPSRYWAPESNKKSESFPSTADVACCNNIKQKIRVLLYPNDTYLTSGW